MFRFINFGTLDHYLGMDSTKSLFRDKRATELKKKVELRFRSPSKRTYIAISIYKDIKIT